MQPHPGCHAPPSRPVSSTKTEGEDGVAASVEAAAAATTTAAPPPGAHSGLLTSLAEAKILLDDPDAAEALLVRALDVAIAADAAAEVGPEAGHAAVAAAAAAKGATSHARGRALAVLGRVKHLASQAVTAEGLFRAALDELAAVQSACPAEATRVAYDRWQALQLYEVRRGVGVQGAPLRVPPTRAHFPFTPPPHTHPFTPPAWPCPTEGAARRLGRPRARCRERSRGGQRNCGGTAGSVPTPRAVRRHDSATAAI